MRIAAIVVTHNRSRLLHECIAAIAEQTRRPDVTFAIDNASTDDTQAVLRTLRQTGENLEVWRLPINTGGAGGFAVGMDLALSAGYDAVWLMDDDAAPHRECLEELLEGIAQIERSQGEWSFAAPVVCSASGQPIDSHSLPTSPASSRGGSGVKDVLYATFVGVLVNAKVAHQTFLPVHDFFLWFDDVEYTSRLRRSAPGYQVSRARIFHPSHPVTRYNAWRTEHDVKNRLWMLRPSLGLGGAAPRRRQWKQLLNVVVSQMRYAPRKGECAKLIARGLRTGIFTAPELVPPASGLAGRLEARPVSN